MTMKKNKGLAISLLAAAFGLSPMAVTTVEASMLLNRFTIGKDNVAAIDQVVACQRNASLESLEKGMKSTVVDYREVSYVLAAAVHFDMGNQEQAESVVERWRNEPDENKSGDEESFIKHAEHFAAYFAGQRMEKSGKAECQNEE